MWARTWKLLVQGRKRAFTACARERDLHVVTAGQTHQKSACSKMLVGESEDTWDTGMHDSLQQKWLLGGRFSINPCSG